jgi:hypothetical protein
MYRATCFIVAQCALTAMVLGAVSQENVQGLYEGACKDAQGEQKIEARVVALGQEKFKVLIRWPQADGKVAKVELAGKIDGENVKFEGAGWAGTYAAEVIKGTCGQGTFEIKRVVRQSPTLGAKPAAGAIVLLDGKSFDEVSKQPLKDGSEQAWKQSEGGAIEVPKGGLSSKRPQAGSFKLHVEFKCPLMPAGEGQGRGNSGLYLPNGEEIQVLDSFGMTTYTGGGCGGFYRYKDPDAFDEFSLASLPPLQWQTYDVEYRVQVKEGKPSGKPKVTVYHNGIKVHDNFELQKDAKVGGFHFQDHGNTVQYRNIWVVPIENN